MTILVIAELQQKQISSGTLSALACAKQIGGDIQILVAGKDIAETCTQLTQISSVSKVLVADLPEFEHNLAENMASLVTSLDVSSFTHILGAATDNGKNYLPRIAALLDTEQLSEITEVIDAKTFVRPIYAGNALATIKTTAPITVISVRITAFAPIEIGGGNAEIVKLEGNFATDLTAFISEELTVSERPDLAGAKVVVAGGRGLQSKENFENTIYKLADKLGAAVGASKAAVDAGFAPNDIQIGQTGKVVAPDLYIAIGISGAIQHTAGIKDSKVIVAINQDEEAPITQIADFTLVSDASSVVADLISKL